MEGGLPQPHVLWLPSSTTLKSWLAAMARRTLSPTPAPQRALSRGRGQAQRETKNEAQRASAPKWRPSPVVMCVLSSIKSHERERNSCVANANAASAVECGRERHRCSGTKCVFVFVESITAYFISDHHCSRLLPVCSSSLKASLATRVLLWQRYINFMHS